MIINKLKSNNNDTILIGSPNCINGNENICKTFSFSSNYLTKNSASESFVMWVKFRNINVSLLTLMYAIT